MSLGSPGALPGHCLTLYALIPLPALPVTMGTLRCRLWKMEFRGRCGGVRVIYDATVLLCKWGGPKTPITSVTDCTPYYVHFARSVRRIRYTPPAGKAPYYVRNSARYPQFRRAESPCPRRSLSSIASNSFCACSCAVGLPWSGLRYVYWSAVCCPPEASSWPPLAPDCCRILSQAEPVLVVGKPDAAGAVFWYDGATGEASSKMDELSLPRSSPWV